MLRRVILELFLVLLVCCILTSGKDRTRSDNEKSERSIGDMIKQLIDKIVGNEQNTTTKEPSTNHPRAEPAFNNMTNLQMTNGTYLESSLLTNETVQTAGNTSQTSNFTNSNSVTVNSVGMNTSKQPVITSSNKNIASQGSMTVSTLAPKMLSVSPTGYFEIMTSTLSSMKPWVDEPNEPESCYVNPYLEKFCNVPDVLKGISFWDLYSLLFSDTVLDAMMMECQKGEWCLRDRFDYWDSLIAERVDMIGKSEIANGMCEDSMRACIFHIPYNYSSCRMYEQMTYTVESLELICKLKRNPDLSESCYDRVEQALHVTLADLIRGVKMGDKTVSHTGDVCQQAEAHMTKAIICIENSCPSETYAFRSFPPWSWFTGAVDEMINKCHLNTTICEALLQEPLYAGMSDYLTASLTVVSVVTLLVVAFIGLTYWKRYRRNLVLKEGYQQLLNDGEDS